MRNHLVALLIGTLTAVLLVGNGATASAQTADEFFDARVLRDLRLFVHSRDLELLRARFEENTYYPADLEWAGTRVYNVGIRSRGFGSRNRIKMGIKVDFDRYVSGQRFAGLDALVLDNHWQEPSMMRDFLSMAMSDRLGQPAPREAFVRLFINDEYQGVYTIVEPVDARFLERTPGESDGYLFYYRWVGPFWGEYLGDDLGPYVTRFQPETRQDEPFNVLHEPIRRLFEEINTADPVDWVDRVGAFLDLEQFVTYVAIETCLSENDGILGFAGMANFYLYRPLASTRHRLITWDKDRSFEQLDSSILFRADSNEILRRALTYPHLWTQYLDTLEQCALSAMEDEWLATAVDTTAALIREAAHLDPRKQYSNEEFDAAIEFMREFARRRPPFLLREVESARSSGVVWSPDW